MMKGFGKFVTFVGITGAALAGLWYFCEMNRDKCACDISGDDEDATGEAKERSYVSLDPEADAGKVSEEAAKIAEDLKETAGDIKEAAESGKNSLKKAIKSVAGDLVAKAESAASGVGLVKDDKKTSDFEFEDFDDAAKKAKKAAGKAAESVKDAAGSAASHIDIE